MDVLFRLFMLSFFGVLLSAQAGLLIYAERHVRRVAVRRRDRIYRSRECINMADWLRKEMNKASARAYQMRILNGEEKFEQAIVDAAPLMLEDLARTTHDDMVEEAIYSDHEDDGPRYICPAMRSRIRR